MFNSPWGYIENRGLKAFCMFGFRQGFMWVLDEPAGIDPQLLGKLERERWKLVQLKKRVRGAWRIVVSSLHLFKKMFTV
jgi:hypothetical protein